MHFKHVYFQKHHLLEMCLDPFLSFVEFIVYLDPH